MKQISLALLTEFELITARYFSGDDNPTKKHIELAIKKCAKWNKVRLDKNLKEW